MLLILGVSLVVLRVGAQFAVPVEYLPAGPAPPAPVDPAQFWPPSGFLLPAPAPTILQQSVSIIIDDGKDGNGGGGKGNGNGKGSGSNGRGDGNGNNGGGSSGNNGNGKGNNGVGGSNNGNGNGNNGGGNNGGSNNGNGNNNGNNANGKGNSGGGGGNNGNGNGNNGNNGNGKGNNNNGKGNGRGSNSDESNGGRGPFKSSDSVLPNAINRKLAMVLVQRDVSNRDIAGKHLWTKDRPISDRSVQVLNSTICLSAERSYEGCNFAPLMATRDGVRLGTGSLLVGYYSTGKGKCGAGRTVYEYYSKERKDYLYRCKQATCRNLPDGIDYKETGNKFHMWRCQ